MQQRQIILSGALRTHVASLPVQKGLIAMRDFLWNYFSRTGEIDVYLLYKEHEAVTKGDALAADPDEGADD